MNNAPYRGAIMTLSPPGVVIMAFLSRNLKEHSSNKKGMAKLIPGYSLI
jgi:hypothetical protein